MIVSDVITRVRRTFGDEAAVQVSDADIIRWCNDAQIEIVKNNDQALQKTGLINLVNGTADYTMPADLLMLRSLRYKFASMSSFRTLRYMSLQQLDETMDGWDGSSLTDNPLFFTRYEDKVTLFPTPSESATGGLKLLYNYAPAPVALSSDGFTLPLIYHNTIVQYCMWQASLLDEDHEPALMYQGNMQKDLETLMNNENAEPTNTYSKITLMEFDQ